MGAALIHKHAQAHRTPRWWDADPGEEGVRHLRGPPAGRCLLLLYHHVREPFTDRPYAPADALDRSEDG